MTLRELAHLAHQILEDRAGCPIKRSHVHELLAAAFGYQSWAAFLSSEVLADAGVGSAPAGGLPELIGRAVQLGYPQAAAATLASTLQALVAERRLSASGSVFGRRQHSNPNQINNLPIRPRAVAGFPYRHLLR